MVLGFGLEYFGLGVASDEGAVPDLAGAGFIDKLATLPAEYETTPPVPSLVALAIVALNIRILRHL